ncbi:hypothetical protein ISS07_05870 [Candidatus Woesearchaeota archaeon]|nr:hypothetical protein [Candidatus Woesearchaeota archaeon]
MRRTIIVMVIALFLISGCSSLSKEQAEQTALSFINSNVKFFAKDQEERKDLPQYNIGSMTSYQEGSDWVVIAHISAELEDEEKTNDLSVRINREGKIIEFNGREVPVDSN